MIRFLIVAMLFSGTARAQQGTPPNACPPGQHRAESDLPMLYWCEGGPTQLDRIEAMLRALCKYRFDEGHPAPKCPPE